MQLRKELQSYFDRVYPFLKIDTEHTIAGEVHIRFELGGDHKNGSKKRVKQSAERAVRIFNDTFSNPDNEIWVLIYEYAPGPIGDISSNEYLYGLFPADAFAAFYNELELVNSRYFTTDGEGNEVAEQREVRIIIGKLQVKEINIVALLRGIANMEMGFKASIGQSVYLFDPLTDKGFHMYDDRGCYVWSDDANKIRNIYIARTDWIVEYHRKEIDEYFEK